MIAAPHGLARVLLLATERDERAGRVADDRGGGVDEAREQLAGQSTAAALEAALPEGDDGIRSDRRRAGDEPIRRALTEDDRTFARNAVRADAPRDEVIAAVRPHLQIDEHVLPAVPDDLRALKSAAGKLARLPDRLPGRIQRAD